MLEVELWQPVLLALSGQQQHQWEPYQQLQGKADQQLLSTLLAAALHHSYLLLQSWDSHIQGSQHLPYAYQQQHPHHQQQQDVLEVALQGLQESSVLHVGQQNQAGPCGDAAAAGALAIAADAGAAAAGAAVTTAVAVEDDLETVYPWG